MNSSLGIAGSVLLAALLIVGVFVYTRSGGSEMTSNEPELQHVHGLAVDMANPNRLLIATHHGLLQFVDDSKLSRIGAVQDDLMGFTQHPADPSIFFSSGHPVRGGNLGFQKSADGGTTWQKLSDGIDGPVDYHSMTVSMVNPDLFYGYYGTLQRSTDGGKTWEVAKGTVQPISLSSDPVKENVVYAATQSGVMISEDKADSWKSLSPQLDGTAASFIAFHPSNEYALAYSLKLNGMGKSTDGGKTWQKLNENFGDDAVMFVAYSKTESRVYAITESNSIYKSTDRGETWSKVR